LTESADTERVKTGNKNKNDILEELFQGRVVGGALSELANYSDLFQRMSEAVFLVDRNSFRVLECNRSGLDLLKKPEEEVLGLELPELMQQKTFLSARLKSAFKANEMTYKDSDGSELIFEISATPLKILDYIEVIQFIARDVTAMKNAERELREMNEALTRLSTTDEMTGLRNYRYFKEVLASVHHQAQNFGHEYGVIFIDVDHFKKFNDRNGHPAGDEVLRGVARALKETARSQDLPARYGGEEFVVLCRNSGPLETRLQAEVVRARIENTVFPYGEFQPLGRVTVSIGVATYPDCAKTPEEVLQFSDQALYFSKEAGRNTVTSFVELTTEQKQKKVA
jgi:diguanylate cyclase (GGDEF)-like protein/PAS domain S-box-containing protein